jgi:hypothetical protein
MIAVAVMQHLPVIPAFAGMTSKKKNGKVQV